MRENQSVKQIEELKNTTARIAIKWIIRSIEFFLLLSLSVLLFTREYGIAPDTSLWIVASPLLVLIWFEVSLHYIQKRYGDIY